MKTWLIEVAIKKFGPSAIRAGIVALTTFLLAHQGMLDKLGVVYDQASNTITIHLDMLNGSLDLLLFALTGGLIKIFNHHADQVVTKTMEASKPSGN